MSNKKKIVASALATSLIVGAGLIASTNSQQNQFVQNYQNSKYDFQAHQTINLLVDLAKDEAGFRAELVRVFPDKPASEIDAYIKKLKKTFVFQSIQSDYLAFPLRYNNETPEVRYERIKNLLTSTSQSPYTKALQISPALTNVINDYYRLRLGNYTALAWHEDYVTVSPNWFHGPADISVVQAAVSDGHNGVVMATITGKLIHFSIEDKQFKDITISALGSNLVADFNPLWKHSFAKMTRDRDGNIYIFDGYHPTYGRNITDTPTSFIKNPNATFQTRAIYKINKNLQYVGKYDLINWNTTNNDFATDMLPDQRGGLYIGTNKGNLYRATFNNSSFTAVNMGNGYSTNSKLPSNVFIDKMYWLNDDKFVFMNKNSNKSSGFFGSRSARLSGIATIDSAGNIVSIAPQTQTGLSTNLATDSRITDVLPYTNGEVKGVAYVTKNGSILYTKDEQASTINGDSSLTNALAFRDKAMIDLNDTQANKGYANLLSLGNGLVLAYGTRGSYAIFDPTDDKNQEFRRRDPSKVDETQKNVTETKIAFQNTFHIPLGTREGGIAYGTFDGENLLTISHAVADGNGGVYVFTVNGWLKHFNVAKSTINNRTVYTLVDRVVTREDWISKWDADYYFKVLPSNDPKLSVNLANFVVKEVSNKQILVDQTKPNDTNNGVEPGYQLVYSTNNVDWFDDIPVLKEDINGQEIHAKVVSKNESIVKKVDVPAQTYTLPLRANVQTRFAETDFDFEVKTVNGKQGIAIKFKDLSIKNKIYAGLKLQGMVNGQPTDFANDEIFIPNLTTTSVDIRFAYDTATIKQYIIADNTLTINLPAVIDKATIAYTDFQINITPSSREYQEEFTINYTKNNTGNYQFINFDLINEQNQQVKIFANDLAYSGSLNITPTSKLFIKPYSTNERKLIIINDQHTNFEITGFSTLNQIFTRRTDEILLVDKTKKVNNYISNLMTLATPEQNGKLLAFLQPFHNVAYDTSTLKNSYGDLVSDIKYIDGGTPNHWIIQYKITDKLTTNSRVIEIELDENNFLPIDEYVKNNFNTILAISQVSQISPSDDQSTYTPIIQQNLKSLLDTKMRNYQFELFDVPNDGFGLYKQDLANGILQANVRFKESNNGVWSQPVLFSFTGFETQNQRLERLAKEQRDAAIAILNQLDNAFATKIADIKQHVSNANGHLAQLPSNLSNPISTTLTPVNQYVNALEVIVELNQNDLSGETSQSFKQKLDQLKSLIDIAKQNNISNANNILDQQYTDLTKKLNNLKAKELLELAESTGQSATISDIVSLQTVVSNATQAINDIDEAQYTTLKSEYNSRLAVVQQKLNDLIAQQERANKLKIAQDLISKAKEYNRIQTTSSKVISEQLKTYIQEARGAIEQAHTDDRASLNDELDKVSLALTARDAIDLIAPSLALDPVVVANTQQLIDDAIQKIKLMNNETLATSFNSIINEYQTDLNKADLINKANAAVENSNTYAATASIAQLTELNNRINLAKQAIAKVEAFDSAKAQQILTSLQPSVDKLEELFVAQATEAVNTAVSADTYYAVNLEHFESKIAAAKIEVDKLKDSTSKRDLNTKLAKLRANLNYKKELSQALATVDQDSLETINQNIKTLTDKITPLNNTEEWNDGMRAEIAKLQQKAYIKEAQAKVSSAVIASRTATINEIQALETQIQTAQTAIGLVKDSSEQQTLTQSLKEANDKLLSLKAQQQEQQKQADASAKIDAALNAHLNIDDLDKIDDASISTAQTAINLVTDKQQKDNLQARLDKIKHINVAKKGVKAIEEALKQQPIDITNVQKLIDDAKPLINQVADSSHQSTLNNLTTAYQNQVNELLAEKAVALVEQTAQQPAPTISDLRSRITSAKRAIDDVVDTQKQSDFRARLVDAENKLSQLVSAQAEQDKIDQANNDLLAAEQELQTQLGTPSTQAKKQSLDDKISTAQRSISKVASPTSQMNNRLVFLQESSELRKIVYDIRQAYKENGLATPQFKVDFANYVAKRDAFVAKHQSTTTTIVSNTIQALQNGDVSLAKLELQLNVNSAIEEIRTATLNATNPVALKTQYDAVVALINTSKQIQGSTVEFSTQEKEPLLAKIAPTLAKIEQLKATQLVIQAETINTSNGTVNDLSNAVLVADDAVKVLPTSTVKTALENRVARLKEFSEAKAAIVNAQAATTTPILSARVETATNKYKVLDPNNPVSVLIKQDLDAQINRLNNLMAIEHMEWIEKQYQQLTPSKLTDFINKLNMVEKIIQKPGVIQAQAYQTKIDNVYRTRISELNQQNIANQLLTKVEQFNQNHLDTTQNDSLSTQIAQAKAQVDLVKETSVNEALNTRITKLNYYLTVKQSLLTAQNYAKQIDATSTELSNQINQINTHIQTLEQAPVTSTETALKDLVGLLVKRKTNLENIQQAQIKVSAANDFTDLEDASDNDIQTLNNNISQALLAISNIKKDQLTETKITDLKQQLQTAQTKLTELRELNKRNKLIVEANNLLETAQNYDKTHLTTSNNEDLQLTINAVTEKLSEITNPDDLIKKQAIEAKLALVSADLVAKKAVKTTQDYAQSQTATAAELDNQIKNAEAKIALLTDPSQKDIADYLRTQVAALKATQSNLVLYEDAVAKINAANNLAQTATLEELNDLLAAQNAAKTAIENLDSQHQGNLKTKLEPTNEAVIRLQNQQSSNQAYNNALNLLETAESANQNDNNIDNNQSLSQTIDAAETAINGLSSTETRKKQLVDRLEVIKLSLNAKEAINQATQFANGNQINATKLNELIVNARQKVAKITSPNLASQKTALDALITPLEYKAKVFNAQENVQSLEQYATNTTTSDISALEQKIKSSETLVNSLNDPEKANLLARIAQVNQKLEALKTEKTNTDKRDIVQRIIDQAKATDLSSNAVDSAQLKKVTDLIQQAKNGIDNDIVVQADQAILRNNLSVVEKAIKFKQKLQNAQTNLTSSTPQSSPVLAIIADLKATINEVDSSQKAHFESEIQKVETQANKLAHYENGMSQIANAKDIDNQINQTNIDNLTSAITNAKAELNEISPDSDPLYVKLNQEITTQEARLSKLNVDFVELNRQLTLQEAIAKATAENNKHNNIDQIPQIDALIAQANSLVQGITNATKKAEFEAQIQELVDKVNVKKAVKEAVDAAGTPNYESLVAAAQTKVNGLEESNLRTGLQDILNPIQDGFAKEKAQQAIDQANTYANSSNPTITDLTNQIDNAKTLIGKANPADRNDLTNLLKIAEDKLIELKEAADPALNIQKAQDLVAKAIAEAKVNDANVLGDLATNIADIAKYVGRLDATHQTEIDNITSDNSRLTTIKEIKDQFIATDATIANDSAAQLEAVIETLQPKINSITIPEIKTKLQNYLNTYETKLIEKQAIESTENAKTYSETATPAIVELTSRITKAESDIEKLAQKDANNVNLTQLHADLATAKQKLTSLIATQNAAQKLQTANDLIDQALTINTANENVKPVNNKKLEDAINSANQAIIKVDQADQANLQTRLKVARDALKAKKAIWDTGEFSLNMDHSDQDLANQVSNAEVLLDALPDNNLKTALNVVLTDIKARQAINKLYHKAKTLAESTASPNSKQNELNSLRDEYTQTLTKWQAITNTSVKNASKTYLENVKTYLDDVQKAIENKELLDQANNLFNQVKTLRDGNDLSKNADYEAKYSQLEQLVEQLINKNITNQIENELSDLKSDLDFKKIVSQSQQTSSTIINNDAELATNRQLLSKLNNAFSMIDNKVPNYEALSTLFQEQNAIINKKIAQYLIKKANDLIGTSNLTVDTLTVAINQAKTAIDATSSNEHQTLTDSLKPATNGLIAIETQELINQALQENANPLVLENTVAIDGYIKTIVEKIRTLEASDPNHNQLQSLKDQTQSLQAHYDVKKQLVKINNEIAKSTPDYDNITNLINQAKITNGQITQTTIKNAIATELSRLDSENMVKDAQQSISQLIKLENENVNLENFEAIEQSYTKAKEKIDRLTTQPEKAQLVTQINTLTSNVKAKKAVQTLIQSLENNASTFDVDLQKAKDEIAKLTDSSQSQLATWLNQRVAQIETDKANALLINQAKTIINQADILVKTVPVTQTNIDQAKKLVADADTIVNKLPENSTQKTELTTQLETLNGKVDQLQDQLISNQATAIISKANSDNNSDEILDNINSLEAEIIKAQALKDKIKDATVGATVQKQIDDLQAIVDAKKAVKTYQEKLETNASQTEINQAKVKAEQAVEKLSSGSQKTYLTNHNAKIDNTIKTSNVLETADQDLNSISSDRTKLQAIKDKLNESRNTIQTLDEPFKTKLSNKLAEIDAKVLQVEQKVENYQNAKKLLDKAQSIINDDNALEKINAVESEITKASPLVSKADNHELSTVLTNLQNEIAARKAVKEYVELAKNSKSPEKLKELKQKAQELIKNVDSSTSRAKLNDLIKQNSKSTTPTWIWYALGIAGLGFLAIAIPIVVSIIKKAK